MPAGKKPSPAEKLAARKRAERANGKVGSELRRRRETLGLDGDDVGAAVGVTGTAIRSIERGKCLPSIRLAFALADLFGCTVDELFREQVRPTPGGSPATNGVDA